PAQKRGAFLFSPPPRLPARRIPPSHFRFAIRRLSWMPAFPRGRRARGMDQSVFRCSLCVAAILAVVAGADAATMVVSSDFSILGYDSSTGGYTGVYATGNGLNRPNGLTLGPDGRLYVANPGNDSILRFNPGGSYAGVFANGGGLDYPYGLKFGPDGNL